MQTRVATQLVVFFAVIVLGFLAFFLPVPYVSRSPGPVYDTLGSVGGAPLITIKGATTYPTTGQLDLTTVSEAGGPGRPSIGLIQAIRGWLSSSDAVLPQPLVYPPGTSEEQIQQENSLDMRDSQDTATIVALRAANIPVTPTVVVDSVQPGGPSLGKLKEGDVFVSVDGAPIVTADDLRTAVGKVKPGAPVTMVVHRGSADQTVTVTTAPATDDPTRPIVGISLRTGYDSKVTVDIKLDAVGGPSAGLMFTLGIYDKLTAGSLTGGLHIAGTGTMSVDGTVGPIGGIQQKLRAARSDGATAFFVPASNCSEAVPAAPNGLRLIKVSTFTQAVAAVRALAAGETSSSALPTC
jgi:PDZ domain-containing protein